MLVSCFCSDYLTVMFGSNNPSDNTFVVKAKRVIQVCLIEEDVTVVRIKDCSQQSAGEVTVTCSIAVQKK